MERENNQGVHLLGQGKVMDGMHALIRATQMAKQATGCGRNGKHQRDLGRLPLLDWDDLQGALPRGGGGAPGFFLAKDRRYSDLKHFDLLIRSSVIVYNLGLCFQTLSHHDGNPCWKERANRLFANAWRLLQPFHLYLRTCRRHATTTTCRPTHSLVKELSSALLLAQARGDDPRNNRLCFGQQEQQHGASMDDDGQDDKRIQAACGPLSNAPAA